MYYGRHLAAALRLYAAIALPAVALVYGFSRFVGTDLTVAIAAAVIVSKALGVLTVAAVARTTFGEAFEQPLLDRWTRRTRVDRVRDFTRSFLTAIACLAGGTLLLAALDDAYGTGRLAATGPAAAMVVGLSAILFVRSAMFLSDRHAPGSQIRRGLFWGLLQRTVMATPVVLLLFDETRIVGIVLALFWLPAFAAIALWVSHGTERRSLADIDPSLNTKQAQAALAFGDVVGPAFLIVIAVCGLFGIAVAGMEYGLRTIGFEGPLLGPVWDYFDPEFFEPGLAFSLIAHSPLFAATCVAAALFAYQLGRIAWFFAYLDARVRRDCWDMELMLAREATRLEGQ